jgi:phosphatidylinositol-3-phosphatase
MILLTVLALTTCLLGAARASAAGEPPIKHVWLLILENNNFQDSFGSNSQAPYLSKTLPEKGQLLANFYATTHLSLGNYIALVSGQSSNPMTQADCNVFTDVFPGTMGADGQAVGQGCVYPKDIKTVADQLDAKGLKWKGYMEDMGNSPSQPKTCRHPAIGAQDTTQNAKVGDQYAARHNPFVYFHSIIDDQKRCDANVVPLDRLPADLQTEAATPNYSFITPNLCNDGHDEPNCVDGKPGGMKGADAFLKIWVPRIMDSPAYKTGGMLIITFDEAEATGNSADASACCNQPPGPNTPNPGGPVPGSGGGLTGGVILSPWVREGSINSTPYNHYALLRSIQALFGLGPLGYSGQAGLRAFGSDVYNGSGPIATPAPGCSPRALPRANKGRLPKGSVFTRLRVIRRARRAPLLAIRMARTARIAATMTRSDGKRRFTYRVSRVGGCRVYRIGLRYRHGRVTMRGIVGRVSERRTIPF